MADIVKEHILKHTGRIPETEQEINQYLDIINHAKEYQKALILQDTIGVPMMKKLGIKTPKQIIEEGKKMFQQ